MPRDLPLSNGRLLVNFDRAYRLRDFYYPHVGKENHSMGHPFRFGVWCEGEMAWVDADGWERDLRYRGETLVTKVILTHPGLALRLHCADAVDFHEDVYLRHIVVENLSEKEREVRLFFCHDFHISESSTGDTTYHRPEERLLVHYKGKHYFAINASTSRGVGLDQFATGVKEVGSAEGTWRDAEDGRLEGNPIAQGSVDSTAAVHLQVPGSGQAEAHYWIAVGIGWRAVRVLNQLVIQKTPAELIRRTANYWHLWVNKQEDNYGDAPAQLIDLHKRSLLILRTQIDAGGAVIAANDSDIEQYGRDTYSYMWPRDGALVTHALDLGGFIAPATRFFQFCADIITKEGFFLHKYNADGSLGSSWHPWVYEEDGDLPVQEDETALVLWALWEHFDRFRDIESIKPFYRPLVIRAANWLCEYRDLKSGLPRPSYDLWEVRYGVHAFTVGAVFGGLQAAARFARAFGETELTERYEAAAHEIREAANRHLWLDRLGRFARTLYRREGGRLEPDSTLDSSLCGLYRFGMYSPDDPRVVATLEAVHDHLWVKTDVGGLARHEDDTYQQVSRDIGNVPGNPWFVCTAWLAQWYIARAEKEDGLSRGRELLQWMAARALPSGVLAEQVHPHTNEPLSVSPLTWSHAEYVIAFLEYVDKSLGVQVCPACAQPMRRRVSHSHP